MANIIVWQLKVGDKISVWGQQWLTIEKLEDKKGDPTKTICYFTDGRDVELCKRHSYPIDRGN